MVNRVLSLWSGVPDADALRERLRTARDTTRPTLERQEALSYLTGATKVLANIEKRAALADYLRAQILSIKAKLYYEGS